MVRKKMPVPYIYCIVFGIALGLIFGLKSYIPYLYWNETAEWNWRRYALPHFVNYSLWGFLVPLVYYFYNKYPVSKISETWIKVKAILASLFMAAFHEITSNVIWIVPMHLTGYETYSPKMLQYIIGAFPSAFISRLVEYWIIFSVFAAIDFIGRYKGQRAEIALMENKLSQSRLKALKLQIQPHFLFNTLHTISSLMELDVKKAQNVVSNLANLLRTTLDSHPKQFVRFEDELEFTKNYLNIETIRFSDRLNVEYDIDEDVLDGLVPAFLLQPLIENAIKHGLSDHPDDLLVEVIAKRKGDFLHLEVKDNGPGVSRDFTVGNGNGIGLKNIKERLQLIFKQEAEMKILNRPEGGFGVSILTPFEKQR